MFPTPVTISELGTVFYSSTAVVLLRCAQSGDTARASFPSGSCTTDGPSGPERNGSHGEAAVYVRDPAARLHDDRDDRGVVIVAVVAAIGGPKLSAALQRRTSTSAADQFVLTPLPRPFHSGPLCARRPATYRCAGRRFWVDVDTSANGIGQRATIAYVRDVSASGLTMSSNRALLCFDARGIASTSGSCEPGDCKVVFSDGATADTVVTTALGKVLR